MDWCGKISLRIDVFCCLAAAAAKSIQSCPTLCDPIDGSPPGSPSLGFSRQEHWSGLPVPAPMHENEVAQSCPTLSYPMDCSLPGSSFHGIFQARALEWGAIAFSSLVASERQSKVQIRIQMVIPNVCWYTHCIFFWKNTWRTTNSLSIEERIIPTLYLSELFEWFYHM